MLTFFLFFLDTLDLLTVISNIQNKETGSEIESNILFISLQFTFIFSNRIIRVYKGLHHILLLTSLL